MDSSPSKERVIQASISLFNAKGFDGTSIRDIATLANVNVAIVSYYFKNKKGLMEYLLSDFLNQYIKVMEDVLHLSISASVTLHEMTRALLEFQTEKRDLARFVYREMTLDNVLIREVMTTYLAKEKFYLNQLFERGVRSKEFRKMSIPAVITQFKGMLSMPFLQPQYLTEVLHVIPYEDYFIKQYKKEIENWINHTICRLPTQQLQAALF
ncbi:forespore capture DNA-binding protein RefZ [Bacillus sp. DJP31]|uniref:forespore capture DNA-binding protein RefZ n=1 Tax=Bacillus sp. DJP31 TaxID=3409789 RepID=UPI003BB50C62